MISKFKYILKLLVTRFHLLWVILYLLLIGGATAFGAHLYEKNDQDVLPTGSIELLVSKTKYQLGEMVEFTVVNHFPTTIYVTNQCPGEPLNVYRWQDMKWTQIHDTSTDENGECSSQERDVGIMPEDSRGYDFKDWPNLFKDPGVYRIAMLVQHSNDVFFQDFTVLEPAEVIEVKSVNQVVKPALEIVPQVQAMPVEKETIAEPVFEEDDDSRDDDRYEEDEEDDD